MYDREKLLIEIAIQRGKLQTLLDELSRQEAREKASSEEEQTDLFYGLTNVGVLTAQ